jgi:hypothetical protein
MCDKCGNVFSENAEGWSTFSGAIRMINPQTKQVTMTQRTMDMCPEDTELSVGGQQPMLTTGTDPSYVQEALTDHEARYDHPAARKNG